MMIALILSASSFSLGPWAYILSQFLSSVDKISYSLIGIIFATNGIAVIAFQLPVNKVLYKMEEMVRVSLGLTI